jgi:hypothetical protein
MFKCAKCGAMRPIDCVCSAIVGYIDVTPKWESVVKVLLAAYQTTSKATIRADIESEFMKMAKVADAYVELKKESK